MLGADLLELAPPGVELFQRVAALSAAAVHHLLLELGAVEARLFQLRLELLLLGERGLHLVEAALHLVHLPLQLGQLPAAVEAALALPGAQPLVRLAVGGLLLTGGDDGADALFQLRAARHGDGALPDEGGAAKNVPVHAGQHLAGV